MSGCIVVLLDCNLVTCVLVYVPHHLSLDLGPVVSNSVKLKIICKRMCTEETVLHTSRFSEIYKHLVCDL